MGPVRTAPSIRWRAAMFCPEIDPPGRAVIFFAFSFNAPRAKAHRRHSSIAGGRRIARRAAAAIPSVSCATRDPSARKGFQGKSPVYGQRDGKPSQRVSGTVGRTPRRCRPYTVHDFHPVISDELVPPAAPPVPGLTWHFAAARRVIRSRIRDGLPAASWRETVG